MPGTGPGEFAVSKYFFSGDEAGRSLALDLRGEAQHLERPNSVPVHVYFVPQ